MRDSVLGQTAFVAFALVVTLGVSWIDPPAASVRRGVCGDGVLDPEYEICDHGAANGTDGCCTADCWIVDADHDGTCDAEDVCVSPGSPLLTDLTLRMKGFATPAPDDGFELAGTLAPGTVFDPATSDLVVVLGSQFYGALVRAVIPGEAEWRPGPRGVWSFRDAAGTHGGVVRVVLKPRAGGVVEFRVKGRRRDYARTTDLPPVWATVAIVASDAVQCSETAVSRARCRFAETSMTMRCVPPRAQRPCDGTPNAVVRCAIRNAVAAQEAYYAAHGTYGDSCEDLPGFELPPDLACVTLGGQLSFAAVMVSPLADIACTYESAEDPSLTCS